MFWPFHVNNPKGLFASTSEGSRVSRAIRNPLSIALGVTAIFSLRFIYALPFTDFSRERNYEAVQAIFSFLIYARETFTFPIGVIKGLALPFNDANIGNVGAVPLVAIAVKALGKVFPYFETFNYFVLIDIVSCFVTAYVVQKILGRVGVQCKLYQSLGALLVGTSFLILQRSDFYMPFATAGFAIFAIYLFMMLDDLERGVATVFKLFLTTMLFPVAVLIDTYTFIGIIFATGILLFREMYEAVLGGLPASRNHAYRLAGYLLVGGTLSFFVLYLIGMYPLPTVPYSFTSYDFGIGGRYHVADVLSPFIPVGNGSLLDLVGFPLTTKDLGKGQYEGVAYVGAASIFMMIFALLLRSIRNNSATSAQRTCYQLNRGVRLRLYSPWGKVGLAATVVFIFSFGYELTILGHSFPEFTGMPAAWAADRLPALYNFRAPGRWASMFSLFLIIWSVRLLYMECREGGVKTYLGREIPLARLGKLVIVLTVVIHVFDVSPLLRPVRAQPKEPSEKVYSSQEISTLNELGRSHDTLLIAPGVRSIDDYWITLSYTTAYYLGIKSNIYYLARPNPDHKARIDRDLEWALTARWEELTQAYGANLLIAIPLSYVDSLRSTIERQYEEVVIGDVSFWSRKSR